MKDERKTKKQLIAELTELRQKLEAERLTAELETAETERKQAEKALRESEREKAVILGNMREHVVYQNLDMQILWANRAASESAGLSSEQLVGRYCYEVWNQKDEPCTDCPVVLARESGQSHEAEMTTPDGQRWLVRGYPIWDADGEIASLVEVTQDITERKLAEEAQERYAKRLRILRQIDQAILEAQSPEEIAQAALHHIQLLVSCQRANIAVFDSDAHEASILANTPGEDTQVGPGARIPLEPFGIILTELQRGETYVVNDLMDYPQPPPIVQAQQAAGVRAYACTPLIVQGELIGALSLSGYEPECFGQEQLEIARELANHLAIVIQQARLHEQVQHHAKELEQRVIKRTRDLERRSIQLQAAAEVARDATTAHDLDDLLNGAVDLIRERFDFYHAGIFLLDRSGEYAVLRAATGKAGRQMLEAGHKLEVGEVGIVGYVTGSGQPRISLDVGIDAVHFENLFLPETRSEMALPLKVGGRIIGALDVQSAHEAAFNKDDVATLQIMADQLAVAIERTQLFAQTQAALEQRLRAVVSNAPIVLFAQDSEGVFTLIEGKGLEALGIRPGELVGKSVFDVYRDAPNFLEEFRRALAGEAIAPVMDVGGVLFEVWYSPLRDENGEIAGIIGVASNITERKQAKDALRESEAQYRRLVEGLPDLVYSYSTKRGGIYYSPRVEQILGYTVRQLLDNPMLWHDSIHPDDLLHVDQAIEQSVDGEGFETEYRIKDANENWHWFLDRSIGKLPGKEDEIVIEGIVTDITERKHLEEQMRLQERLAAVGQLAGGIAHDFNNFLTTIMLYAQILLRKPDLPPDLAPVAETILEESRRAAQLVRRVLDFSRRSIIETRSINLISFIEETAAILQRTLPENIKLVLELDPDECAVNADPTRMQQVVMNLALNARDAMPDGGELHIGLSRVTLEPGTELPIAEMSYGKWVCLTISDTGVGLSEEVRAHLFEPFFTTKGPKGTGLGLAQVYGIVKQHGGAIKVESQAGQSTTFLVYLPAQETVELESNQEAPSAPPQGQGECILLVEDEERVRKVGQEMLELLGYRVLIAANGREALETYQSADQIDLVLTDMVMPEMGGKELVQELHKIAPRVKVLAITGYTLAGNVQDMKKAGIQDVIHKPFEVNVLARTIRQTLDAD